MSRATAVFTGLAVADDQLALTAANGSHGVNGFDAGLQRLADRLPLGDTGSQDFDNALLIALHGPLAIQWVAQRIQDTSDDRVANGNRQQAAGSFDLIAFINLEVVAQNNDTDAVFFQVETPGPSRRWETRPSRWP